MAETNEINYRDRGAILTPKVPDQPMPTTPSRVRKLPPEPRNTLRHAQHSLQQEREAALSSPPATQSLRSIGITVVSGLAQVVGYGGTAMAFVFFWPKICATPFVTNMLPGLKLSRVGVRFWTTFSSFIGFSMQLFVITASGLASLPEILYFGPRKRTAQQQELIEMHQPLRDLLVDLIRAIIQDKPGLRSGVMLQQALDDHRALNLQTKNRKLLDLLLSEGIDLKTLFNSQLAMKLIELEIARNNRRRTTQTTVSEE